MWKPRFPRLEIELKKRPTQGQMAQIELISGASFRKDGVLVVPHHAVQFVAPKVQELGLEIRYASPMGIRGVDKKWEDYAEIFKERGEIREWVLDGFLTEFQVDAVEKTGQWNGVHFWHPTGAGKTLTGILWACTKPGPILVVTRAASRLQYGREFERFTHLKPHVIRPLSNYTAKQRKTMQTTEQYIEAQRENKERIVLIVGWESITHNFDLLMSVGPSIVIFDESHRGKNPKRWERVPLNLPETEDAAEIARAMKKFTREAKKLGGFIPNPDDPKSQRNYDGPDAGPIMIIPAMNTTSCAARIAHAANHVACTTATPIKDRVRDLWAQLDLAEPRSWGPQSLWMKRYCDAKPGLYGGVDTRGQSNMDELAERLKGCIHRIDYRDTHRYLPEKRRQSVYVAPEDQCRPSAGFAKQMKAAAKRGATAVIEVELAQAASKKRKAVMGLITDHVECGHKVLVFTGRRKDVENLGDTVRKNQIIKKRKVTVWAAHAGGNTPAERQKIVDDYMAHPGPCVLVGTGDSFGESLNIQDTDALLFVMLPYTPGQIRQQEGRVARLGQKRPVVVYYVIAEDTRDERVADILINKLPAVSKISLDEELAEAKDVIAGMDNEDDLFDVIMGNLDENSDE